MLVIVLFALLVFVNAKSFPIINADGMFVKSRKAISSLLQGNNTNICSVLDCNQDNRSIEFVNFLFDCDIKEPSEGIIKRSCLCYE